MNKTDYTLTNTISIDDDLWEALMEEDIKTVGAVYRCLVNPRLSFVAKLFILAIAINELLGVGQWLSHVIDYLQTIAYLYPPRGSYSPPRK
jgi:hypothetical protein